MTPQEFIEKLAKYTEKQYDELAKNAPMYARRGTDSPIKGANEAVRRAVPATLAAGLRGYGHKSLAPGSKRKLEALTGISAAAGLAGTGRTKSENKQQRKAFGGAGLGMVAGGLAGHRMHAKDANQYFRNIGVGASIGGSAGAAIAHGRRLPNHDEARAALKNKRKSGQTKTAEEKEETKAERKKRIRTAAKKYGKNAAIAGAVRGASASLRKDVMQSRLPGAKPFNTRESALRAAGVGAVNAAAYGGVAAAYGGGRAALNKDRNYYTGEREKLAGRKASALLGALGTGGSALSGAGANDGKGLQTTAGSLVGREIGRKAGRAVYGHGYGKSKSSDIVGEILGGAAGGAVGAYAAHGKNRTKAQEQERKDAIIKDQAQRLPAHILAQGKGNRELMRQFNKENRARLAKKACINPQVDNILDNLEKEAFLGAAIKGAKGLLTSKAVRKPLSGLARKAGPGGRSMVRNAISTATKNPIRTAAGAGAALGAVRGAVKNPGTNPDGTKKSRLAAIAKNTAGGAALGAGTAYGASKLR